MRQSQPTSVLHYLAFAIDEDRHRDEARRHAHQRALLEARAERPSVRARLGAAIMHRVWGLHSLTDHPCRLPDGRIGSVAVVQSGGDWTLVCRVA